MREPAGGHARWTAAAVYGVFALVTFVLYRGLWQTLYYKDDYHWLSIADEVAQAPWRLIVFDPQNAAAGVRPVQRALFGLIHSFFGIQASAYHVASMLLHALNATLVFGLLQRLLRDVADATRARKLAWAALGAFVFASTSLHAAAVVWLAAMSTLLVTAASILLLRFLVAFEHRLAEGRVQLGASALFVLALACKNTAVALPAVVALLLFFARPARSPRGARLRLVFLLSALGIGFVLVTKLLVGGVHIADAFGESGAYAVGANVPRNVLGAFMGTLLSARTFEWLLPGVPFVIVGVPLLLAVVVVLRTLPQARLALFGLAWILVTALPVALFDYPQYSGEQIMVSRYYYMPMVGACIALVCLLRAWLDRRRVRTAVVLVGVALALHVAFHARVVRELIHEVDAYADSRKLLFDSTLEAVRERGGPGSEVYALGWPVPEIYLPNIGQHFFTPAGFQLYGPRAYEDLFEKPPVDDVPRFAAQWDARASVLTVRRVRVPPAESP